jgi:lysophospholipase L1-like esterase
MRSVLCYGDSNTWGAATVTRPDDRYGPDERWPGVLRAELGRDWLVIEEGMNGRTTVSDDPVEYYPSRNGRDFLPGILFSHKPLDVVAIMLGTNDLKARFNKSAWEIAEGVGVLVDIVQSAQAGRNAGVPEIIVICPPVFRDRLPFHAAMFEGGPAKSHDLGKHYAAMAALRGVHFFNANSAIASSEHDGFHLDPEAHAGLGRAVAGVIRGLAFE